MDSRVRDEIAVLESYLVFCNAVLKINQDRFPCGQIWSAAAKVIQGREVTLGLLEGDREQVLSVCLHRDQFHWRPLNRLQVAREPFYLSLAEINDIMADQDRYQDQPFLMNWDWLQLPKEQQDKSVLAS